MAMRPCAHPGCGKIVKSGYCDAHRPASAKARHDEYRGTAASRGYDRRWRAFRRWYLRRFPLCADCLMRERRVVEATDVHHKVKVADRPDLQYEESNCMALCHECHSVRTARGE